MTVQPQARNNVAVLDVGKTNAKLALVDGNSMTEVAVITRPNKVIDGPPYPHFDLEGHWQFFLKGLASFHAEHGIDAISVTTHGASIVLLDEDGALATPMLDYEYAGPDNLSDAYEQMRPPFSETGSPRLAGGLNVGAQLFWLFETDPTLLDRTAHVITYPQYWGFRLTGTLACDVTSLGCHTDLWNPWKGQPSALVERLAISSKLAPARRSSNVLGRLTNDVSQTTGIPKDIPVACGIHDSNASLVPYLENGNAPVSVVSSGTWVVCMALGSTKVIELDPLRDTLVNVNARGEPVPSARFMGGREFEIIRNGATVQPTEQDRSEVHKNNIMLRPAVVPQSGPFRGEPMAWTRLPETDGQRIYALSLYLALMTNQCLELSGAEGQTIVEGPFARNNDYTNMLAVLRNGGVATAQSETGTSVGAAMLFFKQSSGTKSESVESVHSQLLKSYARTWAGLTSGICDSRN